MSFFSEFLEASDIFDAKNEIKCELIFDKFIQIIGNLKIDNIARNEIILKNKNKVLRIIGRDLVVSSIAKGEITIQGQVEGVVSE